MLSVSSTVAPRKSLNSSLFCEKSWGEATCDHFSCVEYIPEKWEEFFEKSEGNIGCAREIAKNHEKALFGHLDPFNDFFRQIHPPWNNFSNVLEKKFLTTFPKF